MVETFLSKGMLKEYGCVRCIWKGSPLCGHGFGIKDKGLKEGYCDEWVDFLLRLREESSSLAGFREKFYLYSHQMQCDKDRTEYEELKAKLDTAIGEGWKEPDLAQLRMQVELMKLWWFRLSDSVAKGNGRIADREARKEEKVEVTHKIDLQQIHQLMRDANSGRKEIELKKEGD